MIYTERTKKAIKLCFEAHAGQVDKSGLPYVLHPIHLAEQMDDEESTIVAHAGLMMAAEYNTNSWN